MEQYKKYEPLFGSWYISKQIGKGSFGRVFEITKEDFGVTYKSALKVITVPQDGDDIRSRLSDGTDIGSLAEYYEGILLEIVNENKIMSNLRGNSNIVSYEDHLIIPHEDGIGYDILIRMELLTPLLDHISEGNLSEEETVRLGIDICKALELCHRKNIIHRDIKPQNIFISENGDYKLGDFGIARTIEKTMGGMSRKGTYNYMAPEVFRGEGYDATADLYSLGVVLYWLLNGNRGPFLQPFPAKISHNDEENARMRRLRGEPVPELENVDPQLMRIVSKACQADSSLRYSEAKQMRCDLENYLTSMSNRTDDTGFDADATVLEEIVPRYTGNIPAATVRQSDMQNMRYGNTGHGDSAWNRTLEPTGRSRGRGKKILPFAAAAAVILITLVGVMVGRSIDSAEEDFTEKVNIEGRDINFSQVDNLGDQPVDVIIRLTNKTDSPIKSIDYSISFFNDKKAINRATEDDVFLAYGYILPGETGVLYSQAEFEEDTPREQGKIDVREIYYCDEIEEYTMPYGEVVKFNEPTDSYDVWIKNPNESQVSAGSSVVVAYRDDDDELADAWGCGVVNEQIPAGAEIVLKDVIHDPGFAYTLDKAHYKAIIIEKDVIGIE